MGVYTHPHVAPKTEDQQSWKAKNRVFRGSGAARSVGCLRSKILSIVESVSLLIKKFDPLVFKELRASVSLLRKSKEIKMKGPNKLRVKKFTHALRVSSLFQDRHFFVHQTIAFRPRQVAVSPFCDFASSRLKIPFPICVNLRRRQSSRSRSLRLNPLPVSPSFASLPCVRKFAGQDRCLNFFSRIQSTEILAPQPLLSLVKAS